MPSAEERAYLHRSGAGGDVGETTSREPMVVRIGLLGGFRVSVGPRSIGEGEWRLKKAAALIKILALAPGHRMHRESVAELLWPGLGQRTAANNLYYALHHARRTLHPEAPPASLLRLAEKQLALCPDDTLWVDVEAFEETAKAARRANEPSAYRAAIELYAGDLLPGDRYETWAEGRREELRTLRLALLVELARLCEGRGESEAATEALLEAVAMEPTHETARMGLMRLYAEAGRRAEAISQYERLVEALALNLDEVPSPASRRLYEQIKAGKSLQGSPREAYPLPGQPPDARHNLPAARTSFVGRESELAEVKRALATTRLLTLTGAGGSGKTRLALETAGGLAVLYPDGAWLVELAPLSEASQVPRAFARILGVREQPGRPLADTLVDHLRTKNLLLVVDNCEHLVEDIAAVADVLLGACPRLRILATSREALHVAGEVVWPVRPLSVPDRDGVSRPEDLMGYEAVCLFVDRARQRLPTFSLTSENAWAVAQVCRRLDGLPLAIELATARMTALPVEELAAKLEDALRLLTVGERTSEPRQRTLRAALDWSYDPLDAADKKLFQRLSVFVGGWTLRAAEVVAGEPEKGRAFGVLDGLSRLVDKSLVTVKMRGTFRYGMLEPVRQYARAKLERSGEAEEARRRHARYFMMLAEEAEPELMGRQPVPWLERLEAEHGNLRAALSWALDAANADERTTEQGLRMAVALVRFWNVYGASEGRSWLEKGLSRGGAARTPLRAKALNEAGFMALFQGGLQRAIAMLEESLALSRELGDRSGTAAALASLGFALAHGGERERVAELCEEAEALRQESLDRGTHAHLLQFLAMAALDTGDLERAVALISESLALYRQVDDMQGIDMSLTGLGMITLQADDPERAKGFFVEKLNLLRNMGDKNGIAYSLLGLAGVAGEQVRPDRAARLWGAAEALREATGISLSPFDRTHARYEERLSAARSLMDDETWEAAWAQGRAMTPEEAIEYALSEREAVSAPEQPAAGKPAGPLTRREEEVALLIARGLTNRQISSNLSISENTVANHVARILKKLTLSSRSQVAVWVTEGDRALRNRVREEDVAGDRTS